MEGDDESVDSKQFKHMTENVREEALIASRAGLKV
jgi:hypothetical protein